MAVCRAQVLLSATLLRRFSACFHTFPRLWLTRHHLMASTRRAQRAYGARAVTTPQSRARSANAFDYYAMRSGLPARTRTTRVTANTTSRD